MWLLKSRWSNPMKHLIPYLQDDQKAADYLRQLRWPEGITCPRCGSDAVEPRERCNNGLQRFNCVLCAARLGQLFAMFTVNHGAGEYARRAPDGTCVHCNTMEGIWSGLRNFLDHFKRISQRFLHLRVARYEFLHNHGQLALVSDLRSSLAVHFLDHGRLFAADGPSTSPYAANALLPMSVTWILPWRGRPTTV
jgi:hypothetical protein